MRIVFSVVFVHLYSTPLHLPSFLLNKSKAYFSPRSFSSSFPIAFGIRRNQQQHHEHNPHSLSDGPPPSHFSSLPYPSSLITSSQARIQAWRSFRRLPSSLFSTPTPSPPNPPSDRDKEALRRQRILAMQKEISEEILIVSEEEREAAEAAKRKLRQSARSAIYQAYNKVGGEIAINEIGIPKKMSRMSKSKFIDEETRKKDEISRGKSYAARKFQLLFDSLWLSALGLALCWTAFSFEASVSYGLGALLGFGYITLLGRTVEAIGTVGVPGAGVGQARFAMVILLVLLAGKYRDTIQVIPAIIGFSTYQVASFLQAFDREEVKEKTVVGEVRETMAPPQ